MLELEDFQRFLGKHPEIIGTKSVYDGLFRHIFAYLEKRNEVQAKNCVRFYHLLQYLERAQEGSGIYWVFKKLLNKNSEQRREFEKEVNSRFDVLNNQFVVKANATAAENAASPSFDHALADLPEQVRGAIREGNNEALNVLLRGLSLEEASDTRLSIRGNFVHKNSFSSQIERVLTACKEVDILELKGADGQEVQNTEAAYEEILHKIRIMKAVPPEIKMALQTQNTSTFLDALKKLPYEEAIQVVDDCVASGILKMEASSNPPFILSSSFSP